MQRIGNRERSRVIGPMISRRSPRRLLSEAEPVTVAKVAVVEATVATAAWSR